MISPDDRDIGRLVIYREIPGHIREQGVITSFNDGYVFVRYGSDTHSKATRREDLEWLRPYRKTDVRPDNAGKR